MPCRSSCHITDRVSEKGNAIGRVRLSVRLRVISFKPADPWPWFFACVLLTVIARWGLTVKVKVKDECKNVCATRVFAEAPYETWLMAIVVGFHCDVITCTLMLRGMRRCVTDASGSGGVQRVWAWPRGRSDLDPRSTAVSLVIWRTYCSICSISHRTAEIFFRHHFSSMSAFLQINILKAIYSIQEIGSNRQNGRKNSKIQTHKGNVLSCCYFACMSNSAVL